MIFVDRNQVQVPSLFYTSRFLAIREQAKEFFSRPKQSRSQERFDFFKVTSMLKEVRAELYGLFNSKCAYCESQIGVTSYGDLEFFRPKTASAGLITIAQAERAKDLIKIMSRGDDDRDYYWWLAFEWENIYITCEVCNRHKRDAFPVIGKRAVPGSTGKFLSSELALLIDPCSERPEEFFTFSKDGLVRAKPVSKSESDRYFGVSRAEITIALLALNRTDLVAARRDVAKHFFSILDGLLQLEKTGNLVKRGDALRKHLVSEIEQMLAPTGSYCGMCRQFFRDWNSENRVDIGIEKSEVSQGFSSLNQGLSQAKVTRKKTLVRRRKFHMKQNVGFIKSIRLKNFKAIRDLFVRMPVGEGDRMGWKVLLGENGSGKSSVLQAVALALMGPKFMKDYLRKSGLKPANFLRKIRGGRRAKSATISVEFSSGRTCVLKIFDNRFKFLSPPIADLFIRAFGATRFFPRRGVVVAVKKNRFTEATNLFDPVAPVFDPVRWLIGIKDSLEFGSAALSLKDLLGLPLSSRIQIHSKNVDVSINGLSHSIDELSSGYESILVMAANIMAGHADQLRDFRSASGIVLLDEIDAHLHPRWKIKIVESLRRAFPAMQFLVTTHEPLCLRGLGKGEITVLERVGSQIGAFEDLPDPSLMRIDQLLTSNFFGLGSTEDPETEREYTRYHELLAKPERELSVNEKSERIRLRHRFAKEEYRLMANSQREELLLEVLDE